MRNSYPKLRKHPLDWIDGVIDAKNNELPRVDSSDPFKRATWDLRDQFYWLGYFSTDQHNNEEVLELIKIRSGK